MCTDRATTPGVLCFIFVENGPGDRLHHGSEDRSGVANANTSAGCYACCFACSCPCSCPMFKPKKRLGGGVVTGGPVGVVLLPLYYGVELKKYEVKREA